MPSAKPLQFIFWKDLFIIVDKGTAAGADYKAVSVKVFEQSARHPFGIGVLTIVPPDAVPPSADARKTIAVLLKSVGPGLRCACWLVEGSGFQGAMARGVLLGLKVLGRYPYPTRVTTSLSDALRWMIGYLKDGELRRASDAGAAERYVQAQREQPPLSVSA